MKTTSVGPDRAVGLAVAREVRPVAHARVVGGDGADRSRELRAAGQRRRERCWIVPGPAGACAAGAAAGVGACDAPGACALPVATPKATTLTATTIRLLARTWISSSCATHYTRAWISARGRKRRVCLCWSVRPALTATLPTVRDGHRSFGKNGDRCVGGRPAATPRKERLRDRRSARGGRGRTFSGGSSL